MATEIPATRVSRRWTAVLPAILFFALLSGYALSVRAFGYGLGIVVFGGVCAPFILLHRLYKDLIEPAVLGHRCPCCGERCLDCVRCVSFGYRYHQCSACGSRFKRRDAVEPWEAADRPEDAEIYRAKPADVSWTEEIYRATPIVLKIVALFAGAAIGYWLDGERGATVGALLGLGGFAAFDRRDAFPHRVSRPGLWDREMER